MGARAVRKRPVEIQVYEYDEENRGALMAWCDEVGAGFSEVLPPSCIVGSAEGRAAYGPEGLYVWNKQDDQWLRVPPGHSVACGALRELYPISPEALRTTFDTVPDVSGVDIGNYAGGVMLGTNGDGVGPALGPGWVRMVTKDEALVIAAWTVALADPGDGRFQAILDKVLAT